ncbi:hypothetical protein HOH87_08320 [bacterium]|mgnify:CR=1 FL=1|jgi:predicted RNA-binding protein with PIN domain|nr:hypothetical protein [bacterium]
MRYIIDGYNLIGKIRSIDYTDPEKETKLQAFIDSKGSNSKDRFVLVFDGHNINRPYGSKETQGAFQIVFTPPDQSADSYIIDKCETMKSKSGVVIVTSDNEILRAAKRYRVTQMTSETFTKHLFEGPGAQENEDIQVSDSEVNYWLNSFK